MKQTEAPVELIRLRELGSDVMFGVGFVFWSEVWQSGVNFLLERQNSWRIAVLCDFGLVVVMALALIALDEAVRWFKTHAPSSEPQIPSKGLSRVQKLARSRKLGLIMLGYIQFGFAAGLFGFVSSMEFYRSEPRPAPEWFSMISGVAFFIWVLVVYRYGFVLFDAICRRFGLAQSLMTYSSTQPIFN